MAAPEATRPGAARSVRPADARRPFHVPVIVGISAGIYAGSLAICGMLQIETDRALIEDRRPVADAIQTLGAHHDRMAAELLVATQRYADAAGDYEAAAADTAQLRKRLDALKRRLVAIDSIAFDTSAVTGAPSHGNGYGGGSAGGSTSGRSTGGGGGGGGGAAAPRTAPLPPPPAAAPPPTNGSTGASGAP